MGQYLIDNNVISHYFSGLFSKKGMDFIADVIDQIPNISVITEIEALSWVNPDKENFIMEFVHDANILALTPAIVNECVAIRRERKIKTPDAIIAATAIVHSFTLLTSDSDFNGIKNLSAVDHYKLK